MNRLFLGKISKTYSQQFEENFYAGGKITSSWYGGLQIGDFVFPIYNSSIRKLWKVIEFSDVPNSINQEGSVKFEVVKEFTEPVSISSLFTRYKHFEIDLNILNKSVKSTAKEKIGFYPITYSKTCPSPDKIIFSDARNIYVAIENPFKPVSFNESDIRILIDDVNLLKIKDIQIYQNGVFSTYKILNDLYQLKNKDTQRYSLKELLDYAIADQAIKKEKFLKATIDQIRKNGIFVVTSPISLYDNILVGRKKSSSAKKSIGTVEEIDEEPELTKEEYDEYKEFVDLLKFSPNMILYGPPGTGKTYSAQKIIESFEFDRTQEEKSFKQIQEEGRINFITFHQSFSYEEFVEGLRPVVSNQQDEKANEDGQDIKYKVQPGILLNIANNAARSQITTDLTKHEFEKIKDSNKIWKISLGKRGQEEWVYDSCIETKTIAIGWFDDQNIGDWDYDKIYKELSADRESDDPNPTNNANSINNFVNELQEGDLVLVIASISTIRAIGMVDGPYEWKKELTGTGVYAQRRKVKWLKIFDQPIDIRKYNGGKNLSQVTLYELQNIKFLEIKELLEIDKIKETKDDKIAVPYFLIIDEINRGNISKIFGELITIIDSDKRDKIKIRLPYSQKEFSLPSNLYIIGTMNTADRSIAILDTALRRRFIFKEMEPNSEVIRNENQYIDNDLDLSVLFEKLNIKIAEKLDRDHRLGHSYFLNVFSISDFSIIWYYQIIPLLMEYFYNDAESIASIISDSFIDKRTSQIKYIDSDIEFKQALINIK